MVIKPSQTFDLLPTTKCKNTQKRCCIWGMFVGVLKSEALFWAGDLVFVSYLTLTGGLYHTGLSSHRQICLSLLWNNSVDLFYCSTIPQRVKEYREQPFFPELQFIFLPPHLFFSFSCTYLCRSHWASASQIFNSFLFSLLCRQPPLLQWRSDFWQVCRRNSLLLNPFIFIHTNTGFEPLAAPQIHTHSGLLTDSFLLFIPTLTKFTSTPLIDSNQQHGTRGRYQGAWQWICRVNIVEDDLITLQLTFTIIIPLSQSKTQSRANLPLEY